LHLLSVNIQGKNYRLVCSEDFIAQMGKVSATFDMITRELEQAGDQLWVIGDGEEVLLIGRAFSLCCEIAGTSIRLTQILPPENVIL
jgi:hypothetical protein